MDGVISVYSWATGTLQGLALIEGLVLLAMCGLWWKIWKVDQKVDAHEATCNEQYSANAARFATLEERTKNIQDGVKQIQDHMLNKQ